ncbi:hypothetical protein ACJMK2_037747 [Sinanodonta woodiana]|uniref:Uncharacterized protein n=1 Tax=Sinanodonta woodiana TaxID=1069815 RepID=A0ABD3WPV7_SINWO
MKLKEIYNINCIVSFSTKYKFNVLLVGSAFSQSGLNLLLGGEDGIVRIYEFVQKSDFTQPKLTLETKGGSIQTLTVHDLTKFYNNDVIVGDSCGMLTVFCNRQILCRSSLSDDSINCLQIDKDDAGNSCIVTADDSGCISAVLPSQELWRINLNNVIMLKEPSQQVSVKCLLTVNLMDQAGQRSNYILATDNIQHLHIIRQGLVVMTTKTPSIITAMCSGHFVDSEKISDGSVKVEGGGNSKDHTQVALGSATGAIYILHNFMVTEDEYANAKYPIRQLASLPVSDGPLDFLLCTGNFNSLQVYLDGKSVGQYTTPDWINSMDTADIDNDGKLEIVVSCLDNSVLALKILDT